MSVFVHLVAELAGLLEPLLAQSATAAAIVLFTLLVRALLHPLNRAAFRGATPMAGCLPVVLQLPVFFVMYQAFSAKEVGGEANELLGHRLFAAPLGDRWADALGDGGLVGAPGVVFLGLFAAIAAVAAWSAVRGRRAAADAPPVQLPAAGGVRGAAVPTPEQQEAVRKVIGFLPLLSFGTLITAAVVPLAAGLYLLTTTAFTVVERAWLQRRKNRAEAAAGAAGKRGAVKA
ncbi:YidC/Oxa1 family membrane protein insertase [Streptomyces antimicrobicus]|uniref:YidC/Oxa1 family membrane protein insertase n=1 Tax=Streptomyces antimicrobicus TaxID=2883108 RepID=A0ABS8B500_9ACTN|nr:YidC/Oxa1 family membrane protein insertase [Streptomyces antimicrobicus]MCB5179649.1 YidC/Oxa1 family membrane protein insertase [Streptomyces antimicrobicus]